MTQMSVARSTNDAYPQLCYYANTTGQLQITRIIDGVICRGESVVFPGQRWLFEALPNAWLEIYVGATDQLRLVERIPCIRLQVVESSYRCRNNADVSVVE
ncbi:MAG TPA: DUF1830 domain-containing protein [Microcoleaceae cyanobacterium]